MRIKASTVAEYLEGVPEERKVHFNQLRSTVLENLPDGFEETIQYSMISYVVPHSIYPDGYHCKPSDALPFASIASQKNFIGFYHMGIYANPDLQKWFVETYPNHARRKLDMGKSCIRFKSMDDIPYDLIGELMQKMSVQAWIDLYEFLYKKSK